MKNNEDIIREFSKGAYKELTSEEAEELKRQAKQSIERMDSCIQKGRGALQRSVDMVDHLPHYTGGKFEVIDVIEDWKLSYCIGNAVKYLGRHMHKGNPIEDLKKARWYIDREIKRFEEKRCGG